MNILIEPLEKEDISRVLEIEKKTFSNPWIRPQFEECLEKENKDIFAARDQDEIVGYIIFEHVLDEGHLSNLAVKKELRGRGIGRQLADFILNRAKKLDVKWIELEVRVSNGKAKKFYSKLGFKEVRRRKMYYINPAEDALVLKLELSSQERTLK